MRGMVARLIAAGKHELHALTPGMCPDDLMLYHGALGARRFQPGRLRSA
jgi:hypothetical protein